MTVGEANNRTGGRKWIAKMHMKKGALHRTLGVAQGAKIPAKKMAAAASGRYGSLAKKRANLAHTLAGFHKR